MDAAGYLATGGVSKCYPQANGQPGTISTGGNADFRATTQPGTLDAMPFEMPQEARWLAKKQRDVISLTQGLESGLTASSMKSRLRTGRWQRVHRGVYAVVTGTLGREAQLRAALLRAGPGAVLSYYTAAERHGLTDEVSELIHVTVPNRRNPARRTRIHGVRIHRSDVILRSAHPAKTLPVTRVEETVVDLINDAATFKAAYQWICTAIGRGKTTPERVLEAVSARGRVKWRKDIRVALEDAADGALSWLERRYVHGVEAPHGLPKARRQVSVRQDSGTKYLDNLYREYRVCVELDGVAAHPQDQQWRDKERDNWNLIYQQIVTLRYGVPHVRTREACCRTAAGIGKLLSGNGPAAGHPCGDPACPFGRLPATSRDPRMPGKAPTDQ